MCVPQLSRMSLGCFCAWSGNAPDDWRLVGGLWFFFFCNNLELCLILSMQSGILLMKAFVTRQYLDSAIHAVFIHGLKKLNN